MDIRTASRFAAVACLIVGPAALAVPVTVTESDLNAADQLRTTASHLGQAALADKLVLLEILVVPAMIYAARLARRTVPRLAFAGGLLSAAGLREQSHVMQRIAIAGPVAAASAAAALCVAFVASSRLDALARIISATAAVYVAVALVGAAIVRAQPRNPVGWIFLASGTMLPIGAVVTDVAHLEAGSGHIRAAAWTDLFSAPFALAGVPLIATYGILLFPGRPLETRGRRTLARVFAAELTVLGLWVTFATKSLDMPRVANPVGVSAADAGVLAILVLGPLSLCACVSLLRWARRDTTVHAPALRAAARVAFIVPGAYLACVAAGFSGGDTDAVAGLENCAALALGLAAWVGIVRYGLFDTRAVLSRALVYAVLTAAMAAVYLLAAVVLGFLSSGLVPRVGAAVGAAVVVLPLRDAAQRRANRLVYGLRDDPAAAFARLGDRLDAAAAEDVLPAAARTLAKALRLPYVAIEAGGELVGVHGRLLPGRTESLPLPYAGEPIGRLVLQTRDAAGLGAADRRLLHDLSRQVALAARAVALTRAVQLSRQRLVAMREDERRRLRRDLHDGLGPTLAGIALGIDTVRRTLGPDDSAGALLASLRKETETAVADIRRIVYELRPPILDELGLAGAVREQALRLCAAGVDLDVPGELPALPAAVEVAAYRIAVEALTNAARHAPGAAVAVRLAVDGANGCLGMSIADSGGGLPEGHRAGVGLASMRERAAELGGKCDIGRREPVGTLVSVQIPLPAQERA